LSSIGDIVLTEPVVAAIREARPAAAIGFAVKERFRELVDGNPAIDNVHLLRGGSRADLSRLAREIRAEGYAAVVDLHSNARSLFLSRRSGARRRTRYEKRDISDSLRVRFLRKAFRARRRTVERYLDALEPLGIPHAYRPPDFHLVPDLVGSAARKLEGAGLAGSSYAVLAPGSMWETKRWPPEMYASLADRLRREAGVRIVLVGSEDERDLCARVASGSDVVSLAGRLSLGETAAVVSGARLFVGNDSGTTHVSMALDVPTVAIFGPTDPAQFDFDRHALVYEDLACSACSFFGGPRCRLGHWNCMRAIDVERVLRSARLLLEPGRVA
jgi:lipopolysaccharide heptosyltransferase II